MFIKSLKISSKSGIIREINFISGLNLIVDDTPEDKVNIKKSGNNVGKTTVLRLIDFCLGGDEKSIYRDPEFKNRDNEPIKKFLMKEEVLITLEILKDIDNEQDKIVICRNFQKYRKKILTINGNPVKDKELDMVLKVMIFNFKEEKPTFRQIIAKNIRDEAERLSNTVKVLGSYGKLEEYEALYLFWLGIPFHKAEEKRDFLEQKRMEERLLKRLTENGSESKIIQFLEIVCNEIEKLEEIKNDYHIDKDFEKDLNHLNKVRSDLNKLNSNLSILELRKELIQESKTSLEEEIAEIDLKELKELYEKAKILIPELQRSFEQTVDFHNQMIDERLKYIIKELPEINKKINEQKIKVREKLQKEELIAVKLKKMGLLEDIQEVFNELKEKYETKGRYEEQLYQIKKSKENLTKIVNELDKIDKDIENLDKQVQTNITKFNRYFSEISNDLYGEKFVLSAEFVTKKSGRKFYELSIDSMSNRSGTGRKKGEILAFDLSYIRFADELGINCLHFILHDQMEVVHNNQIVTLLDELKRMNCQLIIPILKDKLPAVLQKSEYEILSLSQKDKLFRI